MAVYGGGGGMDMPPRVRFDALSEAWEILPSNLGGWIPSVLIYFGINLAFYLIPSLLLSHSSGLVQAVVSIADAVVSSLMLGGVYRMALKQVRGQPIQVGELFTATDILGNMFL